MRPRPPWGQGWRKGGDRVIKNFHNEKFLKFCLDRKIFSSEQKFLSKSSMIVRYKKEKLKKNLPFSPELQKDHVIDRIEPAEHRGRVPGNRKPRDLFRQGDG